MLNCKVWPWGLDKEGYAISTFHYKQTRVAKVVLEDYLGRPLKTGEVTRHLCHNKACVEISHLTPGTHKDNYLDNYKVGKLPKTTKLTEEDVSTIRKLKATMTCKALGELYKISPSLVSDIVNFKKKSHMGGNCE